MGRKGRGEGGGWRRVRARRCGRRQRDFELFLALIMERGDWGGDRESHGPAVWVDYRHEDQREAQETEERRVIPLPGIKGKEKTAGIVMKRLTKTEARACQSKRYTPEHQALIMSACVYHSIRQFSTCLTYPRPPAHSFPELLMLFEPRLT